MRTPPSALSSLPRSTRFPDSRAVFCCGGVFFPSHSFPCRHAWQVGEGSYGAVYKALDKSDGMVVAVKVLDVRFPRSCLVPPFFPLSLSVEAKHVPSAAPMAPTPGCGPARTASDSALSSFAIKTRRCLRREEDNGSPSSPLNRSCKTTSRRRAICKRRSTF